MDVTNQNIANANTPGYSRQSAVISASVPYPVPVFSASGTPGQLGTGVQVTEVNRARNTFVDFQMRNQLNTRGQADARSTALTQVEAVINEPSSTGLSSTLTKYWSAWQEVANSPSDSAVRSNLVEQGKAVANAFKSQVIQFQQQQRDLDQQVGMAVTNVNTIAGQDRHLDCRWLGGSVDLRAPTGSLSTDLGLVATSATGSDPTGVNLGGGKLQGLIESRDQLLQERIDGVNTLASRVMSRSTACTLRELGSMARAAATSLRGLTPVRSQSTP